MAAIKDTAQIGTVDHSDPSTWAVEIEPTAFGYRVSLVSGWLRYGANSWGWTRRTIAGAKRKGEKELRRKRRELDKIRSRFDELRAEGL